MTTEFGPSRATPSYSLRTGYGSDFFSSSPYLLRRAQCAKSVTKNVFPKKYLESSQCSNPSTRFVYSNSARLTFNLEMFLRKKLAKGLRIELYQELSVSNSFNSAIFGDKIEVAVVVFNRTAKIAGIFADFFKIAHHFF